MCVDREHGKGVLTNLSISNKKYVNERGKKGVLVLTAGIDRDVNQPIHIKQEISKRSLRCGRLRASSLLIQIVVAVWVGLRGLEPGPGRRGVVGVQEFVTRVTDSA